MSDTTTTEDDMMVALTPQVVIINDSSGLQVVSEKACPLKSLSTT